MDFITPLIGAGASIIGNIFNRSSQSSANKANLKLAEYQFDRNLEMWNKQNAYNAPAAQMQRLRAAGLNPNLIYGSQAVTGNTTSDAPKYEAPKIEGYTGYNFGGISQAIVQGAQVSNIEADTKLKEATEAKTKMESVRTAHETISIQKDSLLKDLTAAQKRLDIAYQEEANPILIHQLEQLVINLQQEYNVYCAREDNLDASTDLMHADTSLRAASEQEIYARIRLLKSQIRNVDANTQLIITRNATSELERQLLQNYGDQKMQAIINELNSRGLLNLNKIDMNLWEAALRAAGLSEKSEIMSVVNSFVHVVTELLNSGIPAPGRPSFNNNYPNLESNESESYFPNSRGPSMPGRRPQAY